MIGWPAVPGPVDAAVLALNHQFEQSQWWPPETLLAFQLRQLELLLTHASKTVPFYRRRLRVVAGLRRGGLTLDRWRRIPLLTRTDIQDAGQDLVSRALPKDHGRGSDYSTSGSTGQPVTFKRTSITGLFFAALNLRYHLWHGRDFSAKVAKISRLADPDGPGGSRNWVPGYVSGPTVQLDIRKTVSEQLAWLERVKPDYLLTYSTNLRALFQRCGETGLRIPSLRGVANMGEVLEPDVRAMCREVWGLPIVDAYSAEEVGMIALQCPEHPHYHVQAESVLVEILDDEGQPCEAGEMGRVVVTDLHNFATPLMRYDIDDYAVLGEPCSCGRGLPVIKSVLGRVQNMLTLPSGEKLWPPYDLIFHDTLGKSIPSIRKAQLVQRTLRDIEVNLVVTRPVTAEEEAEAKRALGEAMSDAFAFRFVYVDEMPRPRSGKFQAVLSDLGRRADDRRRRTGKRKTAAPKVEGVRGKRAGAPQGASGAGPFVPRSGRSMIGWPAVPGPVDAAVLALIHQFEQSQWWPPETLLAFQLRQLELLLTHASKTVPFYRRRLRALAELRRGGLTLDRWRRIPLLTRTDIQDAGQDLVSRALPKDHGRTVDASTSGSTGQPVKFKRTSITGLFFDALNLRYHLWHGRDFSAKVAKISRLADPDGPGGSRNWVPGYVSGPTVQLDIRKTISEQLAWLEQVKPDYLLTRSSNLRALLERCGETGLRFPSLREVATMGEVLEPDVRAECREVWGLSIVDAYSTQEVGMIALQCPEHPHYHVQAESLLVEILDDEGRPCAAGESGRVVVTDLHNFATPLIRYDIDDYAVLGEPCSCGRGLPVIKSVLGRVRNILTLPSGEKLWPSNHLIFTEALGKSIPSLREAQLVQRTLRDIEVKLVVTRPVTAEEEAEAQRALGEALSDAFAFRFVYVDKIPRPRSGKFQAVLSELGR